MRLVAAVLIASMALPAVAADRAMLEVIGYSEDQKLFAYEEYGVIDASGAPYSHLHVIAVPDGAEAAGSPFIAEGEEGDQLSAMRAKTQEAAAALIETQKIDVPADPVVLVGDGMSLEAGDAVHFGLPGTGMLGQHYGNYTITLRRIDLPSDDPFCAQVDLGQTTGYAVTVADENRSEEIYADAGSLDKTRRCPIHQRLYAVYVRYGESLLGSGVLMVSEYTLGWEGADRRFVALPIGWW
jgi:predicted secreted protein